MSQPEIAVRDKWDGEDEEDDVLDNWDDDDEDENKEKSEPVVQKPVKVKKKLVDIIAEKEKKRAEELERKRREREEEEKKSSSAEIYAEKVRIQKVKEDSDLEIATELLGISSNNSTNDKEECSLDAVELTDSDSVMNFKDAIINKIRSTDRLENRTFFVTFVEELTKDLCLNMDTDEVKRVSSSLNTLYNDKVKASKSKSKKKGAGKAKLNAGQGAIADQVTDYGYNEYDDFI